MSQILSETPPQYFAAFIVLCAHSLLVLWFFALTSASVHRPARAVWEEPCDHAMSCSSACFPRPFNERGLGGQRGACSEPGDLPSAPSSCSCFDFQYVLPWPQMAAEETFPQPTVLARLLGPEADREQKSENNVIEYLIGLRWPGRVWVLGLRGSSRPPPPPPRPPPPLAAGWDLIIFALPRCSPGVREPCSSCVLRKIMSDVRLDRGATCRERTRASASD